VGKEGKEQGAVESPQSHASFTLPSPSHTRYFRVKNLYLVIYPAEIQTEPIFSSVYIFPNYSLLLQTSPSSRTREESFELGELIFKVKS